jgi:hypothetical protein
MPKCKNDSKKSYKGSEPSPKGLGYCAGSTKANTKKKGKDGNMWIVKKIKSGSKRWVKHTTSNTKSKTKSKKKKKSKRKTKSKSKTKSPTKNIRYEDTRPAWKRAVGYVLFGKRTFLDPDKPLYIRITPNYYTMKEYDTEPWVETKNFTFTNKNKPSNAAIVKFYKKFLNKDLREYLELTHFKLMDVYTIGNSIEYKLKCVQCINPVNGDIWTPDRIPIGEVGFLTWKKFTNVIPDGFTKHTNAGDPIKFVKVGKQQIYLSVLHAGVKMYQK